MFLFQTGQPKQHRARQTLQRNPNREATTSIRLLHNLTNDHDLAQNLQRAHHRGHNRANLLVHQAPSNRDHISPLRPCLHTRRSEILRLELIEQILQTQTYQPINVFFI